MVAVEREHAVGHDQRRAAVGVAQPPREVLGVAVVVEERLRARQPAAVGDRGVGEAVGEHDLPALGERRDDPEVREVAGAEQQRRLRAEEVREALLEPPVQRHRARGQPRGARAGAPAHGGVRRRLAHARVVGEPEVVVRAQQQHRAPVEDHARALRPADHPHAAMDAELLELRQPVLHVEHAPPVGCGCAEPYAGARTVWARATVRSGAPAHSSRRARAAAGPARGLRRRSVRQGDDARRLRDLQGRRRAHRLSRGLAGRRGQVPGRRLARRDHAARPRQDPVRADPALQQPRRRAALRASGRGPPRRSSRR